MLKGKHLLGNGGAQDLSPEEASLRSLDDLLVDGGRRVVHNDSTLLVIDLSIDTSISDEVDDPLLTLAIRESQTLAEVLDVDSLVDLAVGLGDKVTGSLDEGIGGSNEEEIAAEHLLGS